MSNTSTHHRFAIAAMVALALAMMPSCASSSTGDSASSAQGSESTTTASEASSGAVEAGSSTEEAPASAYVGNNSDGTVVSDGVSTSANANPSADAGSSADASPSADAGSSADASPSADAGSSADTSPSDVLAIASGDTVLYATLESNEATAALEELLAAGPIQLELHEYGGFEKIGALGQSLPTNDEQMSTVPGDIVLYQGNQLSFFYGTNSWSYTHIGHIDGVDGDKLLDALGGSGNSTVELSLG